jgi:hypothetical protein
MGSGYFASVPHSCLSVSQKSCPGSSSAGGTTDSRAMYAYASEGETKKRSLHAGDIAGIQELY